MPIILSPIPAPSLTPEGNLADCDELNTIDLADAHHEGCLISGKTRVAIIDKGQQAAIRWTLQTRTGKPVDLSNCLCVFPGGEPTTDDPECVGDRVVARFKDPLECNRRNTIYCAEAAVLDPQPGRVVFAVPQDIADHAGIYQVEVALIDPQGRVKTVDSGLLSVETGLWGSWDQQTGPPTIQEIRLQLRDTLGENDLLQDVEFDDAEILHSIVRPIQQWNEIPPPVATFRVNNFPFRYHWLQAICGNLLAIAAHWYRRNHLPSVHGSLQIADRNKEGPYLQESQRLQQEWRNFIRAKKVEINIRGGYGWTGSDYRFLG